MFLTGLSTAVPPQRFTQAECWAAIQKAPQFPQLSPHARAVFKKVLAENSIATRHFAFANLTDAFAMTPDALHARFEEHAPALATQAAERALAAARLMPEAVDAVLVSTCTGYLCPGLSSYVSERLGLRRDVQALDLVGQGCGAAIPNLRTAQALLQAGGARHVLSICVEICSAAFYLDNDPGVLVSDCIFGDGAAAAVFSVEPAPHVRRVEWKTALSHHSPTERDLLRFEQREGMLRNILSRKVPGLAARHAQGLLAEMLQNAELTPADLSAWILHAGGGQVLRALQKELCLSETDLRLSSRVLRDFGNLSSPFVLFVLAQALAEATPGGWWWMCSFGAGFSCHGALFKVD